jgi:hypothetical protein
MRSLGSKAIAAAILAASLSRWSLVAAAAMAEAGAERTLNPHRDIRHR